MARTVGGVQPASGSRGTTVRDFRTIVSPLRTVVPTLRTTAPSLRTVAPNLRAIAPGFRATVPTFRTAARRLRTGVFPEKTLIFLKNRPSGAKKGIFQFHISGRRDLRTAAAKAALVSEPRLTCFSIALIP